MGWIIENGEHGLLPDHDAEFIAKRKEVRRLVGHGCRRYEACSCPLPPQVEATVRSRHADRQAGRYRHWSTPHPGRTRRAVHHKMKTKPIGLSVDGEMPKTGTSRITSSEPFDRITSCSTGFAMRVRPPGFDITEDQGRRLQGLLIDEPPGVSTCTAKRSGQTRHPAHRSGHSDAAACWHRVSE